MLCEHLPCCAPLRNSGTVDWISIRGKRRCPTGSRCQRRASRSDVGAHCGKSRRRWWIEPLVLVRDPWLRCGRTVPERAGTNAWDVVSNAWIWALRSYRRYCWVSLEKTCLQRNRSRTMWIPSQPLGPQVHRTPFPSSVLLQPVESEWSILPLRGE